MKIINNLSLRIIAFASISLTSMNTMAQVMVESTDAGNTLATAKPVTSNTIQINGTVGPVAFDPLVDRFENDVDMYVFTLTTDGTFTIQANATTEDIPDMNLMVFNSSGQFLAGDDDDNSGCTNIVPFIGGYDSCLTLNLVAGTYYFAVGNNNIAAYASIADFIGSSGSDFASNDSGILSEPSTEIVAIAGSQDSPGESEQGPYTIYFSTAVGPIAAPVSIPTLSVYGLLLAMLGLMFVAAPRLRNANKRV